MSIKSEHNNTWRRCWRKQRYAKQAEAKKAAWALMQKIEKAPIYHAYYCPVCCGWHVGQPAKNKRNNIYKRKWRNGSWQS